MCGDKALDCRQGEAILAQVVSSQSFGTWIPWSDFSKVDVGVLVSTIAVLAAIACIAG
jgi:hypothetical protein